MRARLIIILRAYNRCLYGRFDIFIFRKRTNDISTDTKIRLFEINSAPKHIFIVKYEYREHTCLV